MRNKIIGIPRGEIQLVLIDDSSFIGILLFLLNFQVRKGMVLLESHHPYESILWVGNEEFLLGGGCNLYFFGQFVAF